MKHIALTALLLVLAPRLFAQTGKEQSAPTANPIVTTVRQMEQRYAKNMTAAAQEMPADKYSYKPTPEQISFGHLMMHVAQSNNALCAAIAGEQPKEMKLSETDPKDTLTKALSDSFTYCEAVLGKADDSSLGQSAALPGGRTSTRGGAMVNLAAAWADHYSATAMYLRLNNLLPPSANKPDAKPAHPSM